MILLRRVICEGTVWYTSDYCHLCCGLAWPCLLERDNVSYHLLHNATDATFVICPTLEGLYRQTSDRCDFERSRLAVGSVKAATHICKFHAVHYERGSTHGFSRWVFSWLSSSDSLTHSAGIPDTLLDILLNEWFVGDLSFPISLPFVLEISRYFSWGTSLLDPLFG